MENAALGDLVQGQFLLPEHHVRPGIAVEGEVPVPIAEGLDKGQGGARLPVKHQMVHADPRRLRRVPQHPAEQVVPHLAHKGARTAQLFQHGQHIARRAPRIGLVYRVPLRACAASGKVHQQLAQGNYVKHRSFLLIPRWFLWKSVI